MIWHVVFAELDGRVQSRAARSRDAGIRAACELMSQGHEVRRIVEPNGAFIESSELVSNPEASAWRPVWSRSCWFMPRCFRPFAAQWTR